jgi:hypothetical protein
MAPRWRTSHTDGVTTDASGTTILDTHACLGLLRTCEVGRLAVSITDLPDIFPINYVVDRGDLVFRTAEGTKLAAALVGRGVAFEVDGYDADAGEAWSVVVKGYATEIEQMHERFDALDLRCFRGTQDRSTVSCALNPLRSPVADSTSWDPQRGVASAQR